MKMKEPIMTEDKIINVLQEQIKLYELAIKMCYANGKPKSELLRQLAERLRDQLIEHQKEVIDLQNKLQAI